MIKPRTRLRAVRIHVLVVARSLAGAVLAIVPFLVGLTGCGPGSSERGGDRPSFVQTDSAGIMLSVSPGRDARAPIGWQVDSVPDLVIGSGESPSGILHRVQGVKGLPGGGVLLVDGGSAELRFFDSRGHLLNRAGGEGEGPGEFRDPVLVPWVGSDSLLLFDKRLPRFQVFSSDGQDHRTIPLLKRWPAGRHPPIGAVGLRMLVEKRRIVGGESALQVDGLRQLTREYLWFDPATAEALAVASFAVDWSYQSRTWESSIPFSSRPAAAVTEDGVLITDGRTSEIREYDLEGRLRRILRVAEAGRPVTREMIASVDLGRGRVDELPIPDTLPVFQSLQLDAMGWLWAGVYGWDPAQPTEWMVFDPEGRAHGIVRTPPGLEVQDIGENFIVGVWRDELGVEYVRRHTLRR